MKTHKPCCKVFSFNRQSDSSIGHRKMNSILPNHENRLVRNSLSLIGRLLPPNTMASGCSFSVDVQGIFSSGLAHWPPRRSATHGTSDQVHVGDGHLAALTVCASLPDSTAPSVRPLRHVTPSVRSSSDTRLLSPPATAPHASTLPSPVPPFPATGVRIPGFQVSAIWGRQEAT